jgi:hypothetical protein
MRWSYVALAAVLGLGLSGFGPAAGGEEPCVAIEEDGHVYVSPPNCVPQPPPNSGNDGHQDGP